jgi:hypothetical protein
MDEGSGHRIAAACGVTVEVMVGNAGTVLGKPPALHLVKWYPLAIGTDTAAIHFCGKILEWHWILSFR